MPEETEVTPLAEMTIKALGGNAKEAVKQSKAVFMARVFGEVSGTKTKERRDGSMYTIMLGMFRGVDGAGKMFESERLILPGGIQEALESATKTSEGKPVKFGYDIFSTPDDKSSVGYKYAAKTIIKTESHDRIAALAESLNGAPLPTAGAVVGEKAETKKK